jgi:hypothetical protein
MKNNKLFAIMANTFPILDKIEFSLKSDKLTQYEITAIKSIAKTKFDNEF